MSVAKCHRRIKNIRRDFIHKFTTRIAKNHGEVCIEDLAVKNMVRNHCLARAISDAAWGETRRQFTYKTRLYGSELTVRDRFFKSSKTCNDCGHELDSLPLSVREWICPSCGVLHDRDENASKNLEHPYTDGLSGINASGDRSADVDLKRETAVGERRTTTVADSRSLTP
jgi:putative transposase